ncbi:hypothetical protein [Taklimakanibacter albus]|uniref:Uncharacterized protein n=1 Tax=Taklimakanibacter albus TaxID=2800327 RepID=A0ACC5RFZ3_9HYPH|nr:hypothetical protein [Aestuariivirga sp. YIM B02566]MBK1871569.1 hypothetical protein [Aestuariivirga sp. YIM B02566]
MSAYTDSRSQPGKKGQSGTDDRELFLTEFGQMVLEAWAETNDFESHTYTRTIQRGKADSFPIIGRKRDATEHTPGELITGGTVEHNEKIISLDKMLVDSAFVAEVDELMAHYDIQAPYARQLGESLSTTFDKRVAIMHVLASRVTVPDYQGGPVPSYAFHANMATDPAQLETAYFKAVEYIKTYDIGGGDIKAFLPWAQYLLLSRYTGIDAEVTTGQGDRGNAKVGLVAGIATKGTNHIPKTNITTGNAKFQGNFVNTVGFISNPMAVGTLNRRGLRVVMKEQEDRLGTLLIASKFSGHDKLRCECSFELATVTR